MERNTKVAAGTGRGCAGGRGLVFYCVEVGCQVGYRFAGARVAAARVAAEFELGKRAGVPRVFQKLRERVQPGSVRRADRERAEGSRAEAGASEKERSV